MSIRLKVALPIIILIVILGTTGFWFVQSELNRLANRNTNTVVTSKIQEIEQAIGAAAISARSVASVFSEMPVVVEAFEIARSGNIENENDPKGQEARGLLRNQLGQALSGYEKNLGTKLKLHFHLPNGRSLARMWREKQAKKNGKWVDISDDISSFRNTVLDVNRSGISVGGIELGRGGFVVRGLSPVRTPSGKQLGSVESLIDFNPILEGASKGEHEDLVLFMNSDRLSITTGLRDTTKHPVLADKYVFVSGTAPKAQQQLITAEMLDKGRQEFTIFTFDKVDIATFPVKDYKGSQIGVMAFLLDTSEANAILSSVNTILLAVMLVILLLPMAVGYFILTRNVVNPVEIIIERIKAIAEDRADLHERLDDSQSDEIGSLARWFNTLMDKLDHILTESEGLVNMLNAVPDPIFAVDDDYNIIAANKATETFLGKDLAELKNNCCHDMFKTEVCGTGNCPIAKAKEINGAFEAEVINIGTESNPTYIHPVGDIIRDHRGQRVGYVEVARVVTDLVVKDQEIRSNLAYLEDVNAQISQAASRVATATDQLASQFDQITMGAREQRSRAHETATAMDEMNQTVLEVAQSASNAAEQADNARNKAVDGANIVASVVGSISEVRDKALTLKDSMANLGEQANGIGRIMGVISDIADQTNLLALNAAIEAARAGDAGRGFAVVADEVRKLAEKTMDATKEVGTAISSIQNEAHRSISDVDSAAEAIQSTTGLAEESGNALQAIVDLVVSTTAQVQSIAAAAEEQSSTTEEINRAVMEVNRIAEDTDEGMQESTTAVNELRSLASQLSDLAR